MPSHLQVSRRFLEFSQGLQPLTSEVLRARGRFQDIRARLERNFSVSKIVPAGSHAKGTAVRGISDADIFAVLRRNEARWGGTVVNSETLLRRVRDDLAGRYAETDIRLDRQAVRVAFGKGQHSVDVVPAIFHSATRTGYPLYMIPNGSGGWLITSPDTQSLYLNRCDAASGGKLKKVVQMLKFWAQWRSARLALPSFHAEMVLSASKVAIGPRSYAEAVHEALGVLRRREGAALQDPCGVSGLIEGANTEPKREALVTALDYAYAHASKALHAEFSGQWVEAVRQWRIVFGDRFPA